MTRAALERVLENLWYGGSRLYWPLLPLSWLYCAVMQLRRTAYRRGLFKSEKPACKLIVVGNLVAGGSGKTPLVIALAECLRQGGFNVGIICRGYRGSADVWPQRVTADSDPEVVGDEAVLLARRTRLPVMAGTDRLGAARALLASTECNVLISDDGLQHYRLGRDIEIVALEPQGLFGNGACLPAGPLREPLSRLESVAAVVGMGGRTDISTATARLTADVAYRLDDSSKNRPLAGFAGEPVHALAGIARPDRFFDRLQSAGLQLQRHYFADHHPFRAADLPDDNSRPILMTEKDAVKCRAFSRSNCWYVPVEVQLEAAFIHWIVKRLSDKES